MPASRVSWIFATAAVVSVIAIGGASFHAVSSASNGGATASRYRTAKIKRGDIIRSIQAAGALEAVETVEVSSQLSGQIARIVADYNVAVKAGQVLAVLDSASQEIVVEEAKAALAIAEAEHLNAEAAIPGVAARYEEALRDLEAKTSLVASRSISSRDVDRAQANAKALHSELATTRAREKVRAGGIVAARATLSKAEIDLKRTVIRSPIDGIVIRRTADVGQTVASSFQAPTLYTIARDLADMRVNTFVNEANIGVVRPGQRTLFQVDAYPGRYFDGRVLEIRKGPRTVQNVVVYSVMVSAANPDGDLLPGMTAEVQIILAELNNVLTLPNAALRFRPEGTPASPAVMNGKGVIWVTAPERPLAPVIVEVGASNETTTEISGPIEAGMEVVVGYRPPESQRSFLGFKWGSQ